MEDIIPSTLEKAKGAKVENIRLQFTDIVGVPKNIVIPVRRLEEALEEGIAFDGSSITGYATIEESDYIAKPDPGSFSLLPESIERRKTARINCDIYRPNGERFSGDPKYVLERVLKKAAEMGYTFNTGPECEFFLFKMRDGCPTTIPNDKGHYFDLSPLDLAENLHTRNNGIPDIHITPRSGGRPARDQLPLRGRADHSGQGRHP
jgi:glutamine synthetase